MENIGSLEGYQDWDYSEKIVLKAGGERVKPVKETITE